MNFYRAFFILLRAGLLKLRLLMTAFPLFDRSWIFMHFIWFILIFVFDSFCFVLVFYLLYFICFVLFYLSYFICFFVICYYCISVFVLCVFFIRQMSSLSAVEREAVRRAIDRPEAVLLIRLRHVLTGAQLAVANLHVTWSQLKFPALQALQVYFCTTSHYIFHWLSESDIFLICLNNYIKSTNRSISLTRISYFKSKF